MERFLDSPIRPGLGSTGRSHAMSLRFHEIVEAHHRIINPFTEEKLMLLGDVCRLRAQMRQLDLCCGKAEMLCQWARRWGIQGTGVDISGEFLAAARARAAELGVGALLRFVEGDAAAYAPERNAFDLVSCIGATWIGSGLVGTVKLMQPALRQGGLLLVGEPYWTEDPPAEAYAAFGVGREDFTSLAGTFDRLESAGQEVVEMVLADGDSWDRYEAAHWWTFHEWLGGHSEDPDADAFRQTMEKDRHAYLLYGRRYLGWGVFVTRMRASMA
jgi:SAM-dependent methyltransferase